MVVFMRSDTHVAGAMAAQSGVLLAANIQNTELIVGSLAIVAGGALTPDFDHAGSYISNRYPLLGWIGLLFHHRGFTHTLAFWGLLYGLLPVGYQFGIQKGWWMTYEWVNSAMAVFTLGGLSHLILDSMTPSGVPWLGPISWERYSLNICSTGSLIEWLLELLFLAFLFVSLAYLFGSSPVEILHSLNQ